jgi:hypothetical protein
MALSRQNAAHALAIDRVFGAAQRYNVIFHAVSCQLSVVSCQGSGQLITDN